MKWYAVKKLCLWSGENKVETIVVIICSINSAISTATVVLEVWIESNTDWE